ncbi:hypothetical protein V5799_010003 [Amblyomma americanum]|uniref:Secreted protein n=1 Tax=Amblyomma americanum TaxID=6943 RepID=A0AAQ4F9Z6_AMBAM
MAPRVRRRRPACFSSFSFWLLVDPAGIFLCSSRVFPSRWAFVPIVVDQLGAGCHVGRPGHRLRFLPSAGSVAAARAGPSSGAGDAAATSRSRDVPPPRSRGRSPVVVGRPSTLEHVGAVPAVIVGRRGAVFRGNTGAAAAFVLYRGIPSTWTRSVAVCRRPAVKNCN